MKDAAVWTFLASTLRMTRAVDVAILASAAAPKTRSISLRETDIIYMAQEVWVSLLILRCLLTNNRNANCTGA